MNIIIRYSCTFCALIDASLIVPARPESTDVREWMDQTILLVARDHARRSPDCHPKQLHNLKIPITGAQWVGGPPIE